MNLNDYYMGNVGTKRKNSRDFRIECFNRMHPTKRLRTKSVKGMVKKLPSVLVILSNNDINISKLFSLYCIAH